jgi:hypothetical protein
MTPDAADDDDADTTTDPAPPLATDTLPPDAEEEDGADVMRTWEPCPPLDRYRDPDVPLLLDADPAVTLTSPAEACESADCASPLAMTMDPAPDEDPPSVVIRMVPCVASVAVALISTMDDVTDAAVSDITDTLVEPCTLASDVESSTILPSCAVADGVPVVARRMDPDAAAVVTSTELPSDPPADKRISFSDATDMEPSDAASIMSLSDRIPSWPDESRVNTSFSVFPAPDTERRMLPESPSAVL